MTTIIFPFRETSFQFLGTTIDSLKIEIVEHPLFQKWLKTLDESITLQSVALQSYIRDENNQITYIKLDTKSIRNGGLIPRIIILQGYSLATLIVLISKQTKKKFVILEKKVLIATGTFQNILPTMNTVTKEPDENFASDFIKTQIGIDADVSHIFNLAEKATQNRIHSVYSYCGPSDQITKYFCIEKEVSDDFIHNLDGKEIRPNVFLKIISIDEVETHVQDFVSLAPFMYYDQLSNNHE